MEASGTGNMKFALNGALTIGTLDGANIEIMEEVGRENICIFGLTADQVAALKRDGHRPRDHYEKNPELRRVLDALAEGAFSPQEPALFRPIVDALLNGGDPYFLLADYAAYLGCQEQTSRLYQDHRAWTRTSILNTAAMGMFSSDRTIAQYAGEIWGVETHAVEANARHCLHEGKCLVEP
jgi:starch phosphorylase